MSEEILEVEGLGKHFTIHDKPHKRLFSSLFPSIFSRGEEFRALENVSFSLAKGETLGIIGRNGAGKSTLLQIICGTLKPTTGFVHLKGKVAALLELGAGFNNEFSGRENIYLNAAIYGLSAKEVNERLDKIIEFSGIEEFIDRPVKVYSSGMFVRLAFAIIAHVDADVLVIDEALAVGDALFSQKCMRFLTDFKRNGSIVFVSHDSGAVSQLCDKAIWLHKGEVKKVGDAKAVTESYLEFLYSQIQGDIKGKNTKERAQPALLKRVEDWYDPRAEFLINSNVRNDIQLMEFDTSADSFGTGDVSVSNVLLRDDSGRPLSWLFGGTAITLEVAIVAHASLQDFIVGFLVKNRLGQVLFGENSLLFSDQIVSVVAGRQYIARLRFLMPYLAQGEYVLSLGLASGTQKKHVQHCWIHDALVFSCQTSHVIHGLFGTPTTDFLLIEEGDL